MVRVMQYCFLGLVMGVVASCSQTADKNLNPELLKTMLADSLTVLIAKAPNNPELYYWRGLQQVQHGKLNPALTDFNTALSLDSLKPEYYVAAADLFLQAGKSETTRNLLLKANKLIPNNTQILYRLGNLYFYVNDYKIANEYVTKTIETDPYFAPAYLTRALIQRENGDTAQAIINLQVAVERNPQYYEAYILLASLSAQTHSGLAVDYYKNAITLQPQSYEAYYGLAMYYQQSGAVNLALDWYDTLLVKQGPDLPYVHYNKGYIEMLDYQNYDSAIVCFNKSLKLLPEYAEAYANLGYCYEQKKQFGLSRQNYQKAIDLNPNLEPAQKALKRIEKKK